MSDETSKGDKPAYKIEFWPIEVAIWKKQGEHGPMYNMKISKRYKDGEEWKSTSNIDSGNALTAAFALQKAYEWTEGNRKASK